MIGWSTVPVQHLTHGDIVHDEIRRRQAIFTLWFLGRHNLTALYNHVLRFIQALMPAISSVLLNTCLGILEGLIFCVLMQPN